MKIINGHGQSFVIVGEAPSVDTVREPTTWLLPDDSGKMHSANRLLKFMGLSRQDYLQIFARTNLLDFCPPKKDLFPIQQARAGAELVLRYAFDHEMSMLILGKRAACAFRWTRERGAPLPIARVGYLHWYGVVSNYERRTHVPAAIVPHPSVSNLWWNSLENKARAQRFFGSLEVE